MAISDKIKQHRKNCKLTQKQLAEKIGVSAQAISKWESGAGSPDVSMIVPLAKALNISSDELLEYADNLAELTGEWMKKTRMCKTGKMTWAKLVEFDKAALAQHPGEEVLLSRLVSDMYEAAMETEEPKLREERLRWAFSHAHTYLKKYPDGDYIRSVYVKILMAQGRSMEALEQAKMCKDTDKVMEYCLEGEALRVHVQNVISKKFHHFLWSLMRPEPEYLDTAERVIKAVINDGNYQYFHGNLMMIEYNRACYYGGLGEKEKALEHLEKAVEFAEKRDEEKYGKLTVPVFDAISAEPEDMPSYGFQLYLRFEEVASELKVLCNTPEYQKIKNRCKELSDKWQIKMLTERIPIAANENMGAQQTTVVITSLHNTVIARDDFTGDICKKLKESGTTKILRMITIWKDGDVDVPSYAFRKALVEMDEANYDTEIILNGKIMKINDTLAEKDMRK